MNYEKELKANGVNNLDGDNRLFGFSAIESSKNESIRINILEAIESDRKRIAMDLHDSTVQMLTMLIHRAELCEKLVDMDTTRTKLELMTMMVSLKSTINEIRETIFNLRPMSIDDLGLIATVERYVIMLKQHISCSINLHIENEEMELPSIVKLSIFRIIQEACSNAIKYSECTELKICINFWNDEIEVIISDNGIGFDHNNKKNAEGCVLNNFGISMMKDRVYLLSGKINIQSNEDGTIVNIHVPVNNKGESDEIN